jgi:hypothetical protein
MRMNLLVPLSFTLSGGAAQLVVFRLEFCCGLQPVEGDDHHTQLPGIELLPPTRFSSMGKDE